MGDEELSIDQLRLLSDHQIEYQRLSDDVLTQLAVGDDQFVATSALFELSRRRSAAATVAAGRILDRGSADHYLQASAIGVLLKFAPEAAAEYMRRLATSADATLVQGMIELIEEEPLAFSVDPARSAARQVATRVRELEPTHDPEEASQRARFLAQYG
jgi:hypothetical protein